MAYGLLFSKLSEKYNELSPSFRKQLWVAEKSQKPNNGRKTSSQQGSEKIPKAYLSVINWSLTTFSFKLTPLKAFSGAILFSLILKKYPLF